MSKTKGVNIIIIISINRIYYVKVISDTGLDYIKGTNLNILNLAVV